MAWLFEGVLTVGIIMTVVFLTLRVKKGGIKAMFSKAAASLCFIATGITAFVLNQHNFAFANMILYALVFSMLGDIWLDLKYVYDKERDIFSFAGFGSFMVAHSLFIPAILMGYESFTWWHFIVDAVLCGVLVVNTIVMEKSGKVNYGKFRSITIVYTVFVMSTALLSVNGFVVSGFKSVKYLVLSIASILFALSDLVLCYIYFGNKNNSKYVLANHVLYYSAQFLFASSIMLD